MLDQVWIEHVFFESLGWLVFCLNLYDLLIR